MLYSSAAHQRRNLTCRASRIIHGDVEEYKKRIQRNFDARARSYDMLDEFHPRLALALVSALAPQPGEAVLDVASGTGLVAIECADRVGETGRVVANDLSAAMLQQVRHSSNLFGSSHPTFLHLPGLPSSVFLHHIAQPILFVWQYTTARDQAPILWVRGPDPDSSGRRGRDRFQVRRAV